MLKAAEEVATKRCYQRNRFLYTWRLSALEITPSAEQASVRAGPLVNHNAEVVQHLNRSFDVPPDLGTVGLRGDESLFDSNHPSVGPRPRWNSRQRVGQVGEANVQLLFAGVGGAQHSSGPVSAGVGVG